VIIDCSSVTTIDTSAVRLVERVASQYSKRDILMLFANWRGIDAGGQRVMDALRFDKVASSEHFFFSIADAVSYAHRVGATGRPRGLVSHPSTIGEDGEEDDSGAEARVVADAHALDGHADIGDSAAEVAGAVEGGAPEGVGAKGAGREVEEVALEVAAEPADEAAAGRGKRQVSWFGRRFSPNTWGF